MSSKIKTLRQRFSSIIRQLTTSLSNKSLPCDDLIRHLLSLPPASIGEYFNFLLKRMALESQPSMEDLVLRLNTSMQFLDYRLLKEIIRKFFKDATGREGLAKLMEDYERDVESFCASTSIACFVGCSRVWERPQPEGVTPMKVIYNVDPGAHMLKDLEAMRRSIGERLGHNMNPPLVECALLFFRVELGSVIVTWLVPVEIAPQVIFSIRERRVCVHKLL